MAQAMKTIGAVLSEAADANLRDMESNRRAAITNVQLKGEISDQRFKEEERDKARELYKGMQEAANKFLFKEEIIPGQSAIPTGAPGEIVQPAQTRRVPVDLSTADGLGAITQFQQEVFRLRSAAGKVDNEEMAQLLNFRKALDSAGATEEFRGALRGDASSVNALSKRLGLNDVSRIVSGFDDAGLPQIFAITRKTGAGGAVADQKTPIGHLAAVFAPEFADAAITKPSAQVKAREEILSDRSTRIYQDRMGSAALKNAETNASKAARSTAAYQQYTVFKDAQKSEDYVVPGFSSALPGEQPKPIEDTTGRRLVDRLGRVFIEEDEMTGGSAHNLAIGTLGEANAEATREFNRYRAEIQNAYRIASGGKPVRLSNGAVINPDDEAAMSNLKNEFNSLEDSAIAAGLWQQGRDQIMEAKIAELVGSKKQAIRK